jgi:tRNA(fMet)-specific endonuclease VapC
MLDTNAVSDFIKNSGNVRARGVRLPTSTLYISAVTEGELLFGLVKKPDAINLHKAVYEFINRVEVLPWDSTAATKYGELRALLESKGRILGGLDLMIAAHALSGGFVLVTKDKAFAQVDGLHIENWFV